MTFYLLFNLVIYGIIVFLIIFVIKVYWHTIQLQIIGKERQATLETNIRNEKVRSQRFNGHILLVTNLERTLFSGFFKICKDLIELQKLFLNSI